MRPIIVMGVNTSRASGTSDYEFSAVLAVETWRHVVGFESFLLLDGVEEDWRAWARSSYVLDVILRRNIQFRFIGKINGGYPSCVASQHARSHAAVFHELSDRYLITSDADMLPLQRSFFDSIDTERPMTFWCANAYGYQKHCFCYIGGTAAAWRHVMSLTPDGDLRGHLQRTFDSDLRWRLDQVAAEAVWGIAWDSDEQILAERLRRTSWYPKNCRMIERTIDHSNRIDRGMWPDTPDLFGKIDSHILRPAHNDQNWPKIRRLIAAVAPAALEFVDEFRRGYVQVG